MGSPYNECVAGEPVCYDDGHYDALVCEPVPRNAVTTVFAGKEVPRDRRGLREFVAKVAHGTWRDFAETNGHIGGQGAKVLASLLAAGTIAARFESHTPIKWALKGFGALPAEFTRSGTIQVFRYTTPQRALLVGKAAAANFVFVTVAFEGGVLVGSLVNQFIPNDVKDMIGGTINEVVNEQGWKLLFKHPFGIGM